MVLPLWLSKNKLIHKQQSKQSKNKIKLSTKKTLKTKQFHL
jgi:hypothetical protein